MRQTILSFVLLSSAFFTYEPFKAADLTINNQLIEVPASPQDGGPSHWKLIDNIPQLEQPAGRSTQEHKPNYVSGDIVENLGCKRTKVGIWCRVKSIEGASERFIPAQFLMPVKSPGTAS
jgi:hypothetical protein